MSNNQKREVNVRKDQVTIGANGEMVITDPELIEALQNIKNSDEEGGFTLNWWCTSID
jgi:hypothetical protein